MEQTTDDPSTKKEVLPPVAIATVGELIDGVEKSTQVDEERAALARQFLKMGRSEQ